MERPDPALFYAQPTFKADSPDIEKLKGRTNLTLDTPGIGLALALHYYRFEAFATKHERDAHCGPTAHRDVEYAPATATDLRSNDITIDRIACGHDIDHPAFEMVVTPLFNAAMRRLLDDAMAATKGTQGELARTELLIARVRYTIAAVAADDFIHFPVEALTVFEKENRDVARRTIDWLYNRLVLTASMNGPRPN